MRRAIARQVTSLVPKRTRPPGRPSFSCMGRPGRQRYGRSGRVRRLSAGGRRTPAICAATGGATPSTSPTPACRTTRPACVRWPGSSMDRWMKRRRVDRVEVRRETTGVGEQSSASTGFKARPRELADQLRSHAPLTKWMTPSERCHTLASSVRSRRLYSPLSRKSCCSKRRRIAMNRTPVSLTNS